MTTSSSQRPFRCALVTGGAGFIGSYLVRRLIDQGLQVTVFDNLSVGRAEHVPPEARLVEGDILDETRVGEFATGCDVVFHLAARVAIRSSFEFARDDALTNVAGTASVLRAAARAGTVRKVITASSMAVYADSPRRAPVTEEHPALPVSPYGVSKLAAERLTHLMCAQAGMASVVLRLFNTYGVGQRWSPYVGVVTIFINQLLRGARPVIFGDGQQCRDFVHAEDVARAFALAMQAEVTNRTFNIGSGVPLTVNAVLAHLQRHFEQTVSAEYVAAAAGELLYSVADITQARQALGYQPQRVFQSSLKEVIEEIRQEQPVSSSIIA